MFQLFRKKVRYITIPVLIIGAFALTFCVSFGGAASKKPNIYILATGGTIAGAASDTTKVSGYKAGAVGIQSLIDAVPAIKDYANIQGEQVVSIDSQNMNEAIWTKLAARTNELLSSSSVDAVVITHGTDTMEETAYFLDLTIKSSKPVVMVGSMRPSTAISADGPLNLLNAVRIAASPQSVGKGVLVALNDRIFAARYVTKGNSTNVETFVSRDQGPLGYMQDGKVLYYSVALRKHTKNSEFSAAGVSKFPRVDIIYAFGGITKDYVDHVVSMGAQGIVVAGMGDGGLGTILTDALSDAQKKGIVIVRTTRTGSGLVTRNGDADDDGLHFVAGDDLNAQKARILLELALLKTKDPNTIQKMFLEY
jgi:L-asparaginase